MAWFWPRPPHQGYLRPAAPYQVGSQMGWPWGPWGDNPWVLPRDNYNAIPAIPAIPKQMTSREGERAKCADRRRRRRSIKRKPHKSAEGSEVGSKVECMHCMQGYPNYASYTNHLKSRVHRGVMGKIARRRKSQLLSMRAAQRSEQRELEAAPVPGTELTGITTFCLVCRLKHRTSRHDHNLTDAHHAMVRFLTPSCRVCRKSFRSPMIYEHHICSVEHLKKATAESPQTEVDASGSTCRSASSQTEVDASESTCRSATASSQTEVDASESTCKSATASSQTEVDASGSTCRIA